MSKRRTTLFAEEDLLDGIEDAADEADVSTSEALRRFLRAGVEAHDLGELIPDHRRILQQREEIKKMNKVRDLRGGFEGRVLDQLRKRWQNGYEPSALREVAVGYRDEARLLFEDDDRLDDALGYIDRCLDAIEDAEDDSDIDRLDPETVLAEYEGVARGRKSERAGVEIEDLVDDAESRIRGGYDHFPALVDALANSYGVPEETAEEAVQRARDNCDR